MIESEIVEYIVNKDGEWKSESRKGAEREAIKSMLIGMHESMRMTVLTILKGYVDRMSGIDAQHCGFDVDHAVHCVNNLAPSYQSDFLYKLAEAGMIPYEREVPRGKNDENEDDDDVYGW